MPTTFSFIALFSWPLVVVILFRLMPLPKALCWSLVAGYLLLPTRVGMNFPMLPSIDKSSVPSVAAAVMCLLLAYRDRLEEARLAGPGRSSDSGVMARLRSIPRGGAARLTFYALLALLFVSPVATVLSNREPLVYGPRILAGLTPYDIGSMVQGAVIMLLPFMLAMRFLATSERHVILLRTLVFAALAYSLLVLVEIRLSPQLHTWLYGFFPHSFAQHTRGGGFRPIVFLSHGLLLAIFLAMAVVSACVLWRQALRDRIGAAPWLMAAAWLGIVLLLSRNLGASVLMVAFAPLALLAPPRVQILVAAIVAGTVLLFPMARSAGLVPTEALVSAAARIDPGRAQSLAFRLRHEDMLLEKAAEKPLYGWGRWGRNRVYDEETGADQSVTDGAWVIIIGQSGWIGYIAGFGLMTMPIILLALRRRDQLSPATAGLALVSAVVLVDTIPNAPLTPVTWLVAGALAGRYLREEQLVSAPSGPGRAPDPSGTGGPGPWSSGLGEPVPRHVRRSRGPAPGGGTAAMRAATDGTVTGGHQAPAVGRRVRRPMGG